MRGLLVILFCFFTHFTFGQPRITNYLSFAIDNKEVIWIQVYHHDENQFYLPQETEYASADSIQDISSKVFEHLKHKPWIANIHYEGDDILADLVAYRPDYKRYGGKFVNTSVIIRTGQWTGKVRINFKKGKYRTLLYGLTYTAEQPETNAGKMSMEQHTISGTLSDFALNNYRTAFKRQRFTNLDILHASFKDSFTLKTDQLIDRDW
jgi:hypothetical protein